VRKLKISLLAAIVIGFISMTGGCKKTTENITQGTDSVYSSGWLTISTPVVTDQYGDTAYQETFTNSAITSAVVSDGVVLSYMGYTESTGTGTTTDTVAEQASEFGVYTSYVVGSVIIDSYPTDEGGYGDLTTGTSGLLYRYVIVPGSVLATTKLTKQQAKSMSYTEITKALTAAKTSSATSITQ
jgi:hypothetical protein